MATSGSSNYTTNRDSLITAALRVLGTVAQGESPTADQLTEGAEALNFMVKAWHSDGMPLWAVKEYSITPVLNTRSYRIGIGQTIDIPKPLRIIDAYYHIESSNVDIPMILLTREEYNTLGNKESSGSPIQFYYDVQTVYGDLFVYPVPDSSSVATGNYIRIVYQRPYEDFDSSTDEPDFPQEWFDALKFNLALRLAPEYGIPPEQFNMLRALAKESKDAALSFGTEEGSMYFQVARYNW